MEKEKKIAVAFFGLVKRIDDVYPSIKSYILDPLEKDGYRFDFYYHTYNEKTISNPRNQERDNSIDPLSIETKFTFRDRAVDTVEGVWPQLEDLYRLSLRYGDPWPDNKGLSLKNLLLALWSQYRLTQLWKPNRSEYQYIIYLRPDVRFLNKLEIPSVVGRNGGIWIPTFHTWGGYNDRFALGTPTEIITYGERFVTIRSYFDRHRRNLHSETFLYKTLRDNGINVYPLSLVFRRIRADGHPAPGDLKLKPISPKVIPKVEPKVGPRIESKFNWVNYLNRYPDLRRNGIRTAKQAEDHYLKHGRREGRNPS